MMKAIVMGLGGALAVAGLIIGLGLWLESRYDISSRWVGYALTVAALAVSGWALWQVLALTN